MLLEVKNLTVHYGMVKALGDVSFQVDEGEIVSMIGPNGAGKSTALNAVNGVLQITDGRIESGEILFRGKSIKQLQTHELVSKGISLVPEGRRVFPTMTVLENLEMGGYTSGDGTTLQHGIESVFDLFPELGQRKGQKAGTLSSGEQQMLAIGRALMLKPALLLLDEPSLGLSPDYVAKVFESLVEINKGGTSILLVEQNARMALEVCHRAYVFDIGSIAMEGDRKTLLKDPRIKKVFLGA
ncbi:MAG: ABC transporter ATP-binding protein [Nitrososphaerales archaeon]